MKRLIILVTLLAIALPLIVFADTPNTYLEVKAMIQKQNTLMSDDEFNSKMYGADPSVIRQAYTYARIAGLNPDELTQIKSQVIQLQTENANLKAQIDTLQNNIITVLTAILEKLK